MLVGIIALLLLVLPWYAKGHKDKNGVVTYPNAAIVNPIVAGLGAAGAIYAALRQAQTATRRHEAQTEADRQRRITESFTKAIEHLGSDNLQVRLGGIYTLERISRESELDYWPVMETLTGFVRERARWKDEMSALPRIDVHHGYGPPTDVAAVLTVINRRDPRSREREQAREWRLDFALSDLRRAFLVKAPLEGANLREAHLERADLSGANLEGANLREAHLEGANLLWANLEGADLSGVHLKGADLSGANLEGVFLQQAHLEGANLQWVKGLLQDQLADTSGNAETLLPDGLTWPAHWLAAHHRSPDRPTRHAGALPEYEG